MSTSPSNFRTFATDSHRHAVLLPHEMSRVDQDAIASGIAGDQLMESAGREVAAQVCKRWTPQPVYVMCGPGNNGGDGFVIARLLQEQGWPVRVGLWGNVSQLKGDARKHAQRWQGNLEKLTPDCIKGSELVIDALFGTGLSRPLDGTLRDVVVALNNMKTAVCSVDIPSGVDGASGQVLGSAVDADLTVTFHRKKPGQLLMPGRMHCGELIVVDIGIPEYIVATMTIQTHENHPELWLDAFPWPHQDDHKYRRGHVLIQGGDLMTGAARLAAMAAARAGAGLVSVAAPSRVWAVYATALTNIVLPCDGLDAWRALLADMRRNVVVLGPGAGPSQDLRCTVLATLHDGSRTVVLDADALTAFAGQGDTLFQAIDGPCVMTPHSAEFDRLFSGAVGDNSTVEPDHQAHGEAPANPSKLERAREAARISGAVVILKGADTVIAAPDGRAVINSNAPPHLATGGTGDVLAGIVAGLAAQGMEVFYAAAAAVWMHGRAAVLFGPGLIAEDLPSMLVKVVHELKDMSRER